MWIWPLQEDISTLYAFEENYPIYKVTVTRALSLHPSKENSKVHPEIQAWDRFLFLGLLHWSHMDIPLIYPQAGFPNQWINKLAYTKNSWHMPYLFL